MLTMSANTNYFNFLPGVGAGVVVVLVVLDVVAEWKVVVRLVLLAHSV